MITEREQTLQEAQKIVCGDRDTQYGRPEDNFKTVAAYWTQYITGKGALPLSETDVANMMILFKIARNTPNTKHDNWVDIAGYAACGSECDSTKGRE